MRKTPRKTDHNSLGLVAGSAKKPKVRRTRSHAISMADLFLWTSIVDECLYHPTGALERAAITEGYSSVGNVTQRLDFLEKQFGRLIYRNAAGIRSGVPTFRGAALAEFFVVIELLFTSSSRLHKSGLFGQQLHKLKTDVVSFVDKKSLRIPDKKNSSRIRAAHEWRCRQLKTGRNHIHKKLPDWPTLSPSPVKASK
jgi:hypothetical protein